LQEWLQPRIFQLQVELHLRLFLVEGRVTTEILTVASGVTNEILFLIVNRDVHYISQVASRVAIEIFQM
jgi:hypothetical protein